MKNDTEKDPKPIRSTVVENIDDWNALWKMALTLPTEAQIKEMKQMESAFFPEYSASRQI
jgi:hypothetical protein